MSMFPNVSCPNSLRPLTPDAGHRRYTKNDQGKRADASFFISFRFSIYVNLRRELCTVVQGCLPVVEAHENYRSCHMSLLDGHDWF